MTTIGELVEVLFTKYELQLRDRKAAAVATQVTIEGMLRRRPRR
jgi:hypothetical protein